MRECVDEGILQGYADGELSLEMTEAVVAHIAACAACATALRVVESEGAVLMAALAPEMSLGVPTERLRERLDAAIIAGQPQTRMVTENSVSARLREWFAALFAPLAFAPRQAVGFASLVAVITFALIFSVIYFRRSASEYAQGAVATAPVAFSIPEWRATETKAPVPEKPTPAVQLVAVKHQIKNATLGNTFKERRIEDLPLHARNLTTLLSLQPGVKQQGGDTLLPGERSYLTAIASLTTTLETSGEAALKPSLRVEYERNLAVVNQAIEETRRAARSNPNDQDAASFLLVAYQSKVDLLNTVADQARLSAAAR